MTPCDQCKAAPCNYALIDCACDCHRRLADIMRTDGSPYGGISRCWDEGRTVATGNSWWNSNLLTIKSEPPDLQKLKQALLYDMGSDNER